jgi:predicted aminopeptidase
MRSVLTLLLLPALYGCATTEYYWQGIAVNSTFSSVQPVPAVIENPSDATLKRKLERSGGYPRLRQPRTCASDSGSYRSYAEIGRRFVLWNVIATPELSLEPRQWCFPIAGCVNYRGYFEEAAAKGEATKFAVAGDDVHVSGVPAFSTLGYFNDPILSTFVRYPDPELARLVFHELAHQVAYAKDDSVFNESFAVTVEEVGVERWLATQNDPALAAQFASSQRYREGFRELVARTRGRLAALYASDASDETKRAGKAAAFAQMRTEYAALKEQWGGSGGYDGWFAQGPTNASLAAVALYSRKVPEFRALLTEEGGNLPRFYARCGRSSRACPRRERDAYWLLRRGVGAAEQGRPDGPSP